MINSLTHSALDIRWMTEATWFHSDDASVVRAGVLLLEAAFRSTQPATLPGDPLILSRLSGLSANVWTEKGRSVLQGFDEVEGGAWRHRAMAELFDAVNDRFGGQIQELVGSSVLASLAVEEFPLVGEIKPAGRSKGKRALAKDFQFNDALLKKAEAAGYITDEHKAWLLEKFKDFATSSTRLYSNWDATARNFFSSSITQRDFLTCFGYWPRDSRARLTPAQGERAPVRSGPQSFESAALNGSKSSVDRVLAKRFGTQNEVQDAEAKPVTRPAPGGFPPRGFGFSRGAGAPGAAA
ncbi:YdaU family protein [Variovorax sp. LjRoot175]|uniref:hypothetical protein n=1 Tax=Variovorax sp. LjRoot175 TaxID=3342276 RepID=UPI003ED01B7E